MNSQGILADFYGNLAISLQDNLSRLTVLVKRKIYMMMVMGGFKDHKNH